jgi:DNA-binding NarL/FixJ family response regulator
VPERFTSQAPDLQVLPDDARRHVALVGLPPVYSRGLQLVLRASTPSCTVANDLAQLPALLADPRPLTVVVPVVGAADALQTAGAAPTGAAPGRHAVVVLLDDATPEECGRLLRAGVTGILTASDAPEDVVTGLRCAGRGQTVLPRGLAEALCRPATRPPPPLTPVERAWLQGLAAGGTVAALARTCGYSEREMYRRLSTVYANLGARTRTEALLLAERLGLLDHRA